MRLLSRAFDVTALCFYRASDRQTVAQVAAGVRGLEPFAHVEAFPIPQERNAARLVWDHLRSVATETVYTRYAYESRALQRRLLELLASKTFDLVHLDSLDLSGYLPFVGHLPTVCVHHNVESVLLRRRAMRERSLVRRAYVAHQADLLEREERTWCPRVTLNAVVSAPDATSLRSISPSASITVIPNGVDTGHFTVRDGACRGVVFVGGANWFPNRDALDHYCTDILPLLKARTDAVSTRWIGHAPADLRTRVTAEHGIEMTGYVPDVRPYVNDAACFIAPLRVGGGTRVKILDAWAMGKAVVTTSVGCEGLAAEDGVNVLVRDTPAEFADAIALVLSDRALRVRLGSNARATVERLYSWDVIGENMINEYLSLVEAPASVGSASGYSGDGMTRSEP